MPDPVTPPVVVQQTPDPNNLEAVGKATEVRPEDDPNLALQSLIAKRQRKNDEKPAKTEEKPEKTESKAAPETSENLSNLISKALKFREKKAEKEEKPDKAAEDTGKTDADKAGSGDSSGVGKSDEVDAGKQGDDKDAGQSKTIVTKRKKQVPVPDPVQIATAAATAAVQAATASRKEPVTPEKGPEELLDEDEQYEYEVAKHLAATNPKYKNAPREFLTKVRKTAEYASRWEKENPGKRFNAEDEEHNDFYDSQPKLWTEREFRAAEASLLKSPKEEELLRELRTLKEDAAKIELSQAVQTANIRGADQLARALGDDIHKKIASNWNEFVEQDPITSKILVDTLNGISPVIEAIVQLDEPKGRIRFSQDNPAHQEWLKLIQEKEAQYAGVRDDSGKLFATRNEWFAMNEGQRRNRWWLTPDHLLSEVLADASETVAERINAEKEKQKKIALSLGFVPKAEQNNGDTKSGATKTGDDKKEEKADRGAQKPVSPSVGSGAKIDAKEESPKTGTARLLETTASILFRR